MSANTKKIIVGTDFSDSSAVALYHAINLAERLKAQLHIAHITQASLTVPTDLGLNVPPELEEAKQARERLERMRTMIGGNLDVELHLRVGQPVTELLELVREIRPEMVVLGSHGRSAVMRMLLGSVSTELMRRSPVPVLVVPAPGREAELDAQPKVEPAPADAGMPAVGQAPAPDTHEYINFSIGSASAVGTAPAGTSGYDVNPELRVRY
jgi:nucleotide-binding universal stress UspA family protein